MNHVARFSLLSVLFLSAAFAQRDLSTLAGTVTDTSGGVVVNASVKIVEQATGLAYETLTNNAGEFVRPALKPSTYTVTVSAPGFKRAEQKDVLLTAGDRNGVSRFRELRPEGSQRQLAVIARARRFFDGGLPFCQQSGEEHACLHLRAGHRHGIVDALEMRAANA